MNRLPSGPSIQPNDTILQFGLRVLAFIIADNVTATLTDIDLELAEYAGQYAVSAPDILPIAVDRISAARHIVASALVYRRSLLKTPQAPIFTGCSPDTKPNEGPMAKLLATPISRPPSGQLVKPDVQF